MPLLGPDGKPLPPSNKKAAPPALGEKYGQWGGPDVQIFQLPGGGILQFDLGQLTLADYRQMTDHYQINSSLTVLMFLLHQMEWRVECSNKSQRDFYEEQLQGIWTPLVRSKSTAFWAGFSPNILQWENDTPSRRITLTKIKDLVPEESFVKWKTVNGAKTNKISVYDGIKPLRGTEIPKENTYWYPLLAQNGDYTGKKLLRSAFQPWFFSQLVHLFANRYYERFGEPTPIGRAPYDDDIRYGGETMRGNQAMEHLLNQLRNRSAVVLPADKTQFGEETTLDYDYQIEYLESTMRGADFERYMTRLDEEMSLALFTPILLMRTADVGSYNLGTQHSIIYQWMLNALSGDWKYYIDWYLLKPLRDYNFGVNAERPQISFRRMGDQRNDLVNNVIAAMVSKGSVKFDYEQLGEIAGLSLEEVKVLTEEPGFDNGGGDPSKTSPETDGGTGTNEENRAGVHRVAASLRERIAKQVTNAFRKNNLEEVKFSLGFERQFEAALEKVAGDKAFILTRNFYGSLEAYLYSLVDMGYSSSESFMRAVDGGIEYQTQNMMKGL